jgi:hypothetical protein
LHGSFLGAQQGGRNGRDEQRGSFEDFQRTGSYWHDCFQAALVVAIDGPLVKPFPCKELHIVLRQLPMAENHHCDWKAATAKP